MQRLFIGIELPDEVRRALAAVRNESPELDRALGWTRPAGLHLTLRFLGDTPAERMEAVRAGLQLLPARPSIGLHAAGLGLFGSAARPRVLWAGVKGELAALAALHRDVEEMCVGLGWPTERQGYAPHITLARARGRFAAADALQTLLERRRRAVFGAFRAGAVVLFDTQLAPGGSIYTPIARRQLGG